MENLKYKNKYRIQSSRLQSWNYDWDAAYFITICTKNKVHYLGDIVNDEMQLNENGLIAKKYWHEIPEHFSFVKIEAFVVMPNHIHGIIVIDKSDDNNKRRDAIHRVSITENPITQEHGGITGNKNPMLHDNLSRIIRWYKGRVTFESRKVDKTFTWQPRFHDHIIRNEKSFNQITEYVINNPHNWEKDKFHPDFDNLPLV